MSLLTTCPHCGVWYCVPDIQLQPAHVCKTIKECDHPIIRFSIDDEEYCSVCNKVLFEWEKE